MSDYMRGNKGLKIANSEEFITREEMNSRINEITKCKRDPIYFANKYFTIISPKRGKHIIETYDKQDSMLETFQKNRRVICCSSRQIGKCIVYMTWIKIRHKKYNWLKLNIPIGLFFDIAKTLNK